MCHVSPKDFVDYWKKFYDSSKYPEELYQQKGVAGELTETRVVALFKWKNGGKLNQKQTKSVIDFHKKHNRWAIENGEQDDVKKERLRKYLIRRGGAIFRIFWLHMQYPKEFPIYDQHVHRAMAFLLKREGKEIPPELSTNQQRGRFYLDEYIKFFQRFTKDRCDSRDVDKALWAFGKLLSGEYKFFE